MHYTNFNTTGEQDVASARNPGPPPVPPKVANPPNQQARNAGRGSFNNSLQAPARALTLEGRFPGFNLKQGFVYSGSCAGGRLSVTVDNRDVAKFVETARPAQMDAGALLNFLRQNNKLSGEEYTPSGFSESGHIPANIDMDDASGIRDSLDATIAAARLAMSQGQRPAAPPSRPPQQAAQRYAAPAPQAYAPPISASGVNGSYAAAPRRASGTLSLNLPPEQRYPGFDLSAGFRYSGSCAGGHLAVPIYNADIAKFLDSKPAQANAAGLLRFLADSNKLSGEEYTPSGSSYPRPIPRDIDMDDAHVIRDHIDGALQSAKLARYQGEQRAARPPSPQYAEFQRATYASPPYPEDDVAPPRRHTWPNAQAPASAAHGPAGGASQAAYSPEHAAAYNYYRSAATQSTSPRRDSQSTVGMSPANSRTSSYSTASPANSRTSSFSTVGSANSRTNSASSFASNSTAASSLSDAPMRSNRSSVRNMISGGYKAFKKYMSIARGMAQQPALPNRPQSQASSAGANRRWSSEAQAARANTPAGPDRSDSAIARARMNELQGLQARQQINTDLTAAQNAYLPEGEAAAARRAAYEARISPPPNKPVRG